MMKEISAYCTPLHLPKSGRSTTQQTPKKTANIQAFQLSDKSGFFKIPVMTKKDRERKRDNLKSFVLELREESF